MKRMKIFAAGMILAFVATTVSAQERGCILLKTVAEIEKVDTNERGEKTTRLVSAEKIVPGDEVVYTVSATNICDEPADAVVIDNPVPEHMKYLANSAIGPGTEVTYSIDSGFHYDKPAALKVSNPDGSQREARADEYTNIRWVMRNPLKPGSVAFARFRARLE
jgi:uncharacterized repeat protein (TIGR01451 family)